MSLPDLAQTLDPVLQVFERLGIAYYVTGSIAGAAYGVQRTTLDVDIVAEVRPEHARAIADALKDTFYVNEAAVRDAVARGGCFNPIHIENQMKVDIHARKPSPFQDEAMRRRRMATLATGGTPLRCVVATAEDVVLSKLRWYRAGSGVSERPLGEVAAVLRVERGRLDLDYLRRWAQELRVADLLEKALAEAEEAET